MSKATLKVSGLWSAFKDFILSVPIRFKVIRSRIKKVLLPIRRRATAPKLTETINSELYPCPVCFEILASKDDAGDLICLSCGKLRWTPQRFVKETETN